jgi:hypothetical protein
MLTMENWSETITDINSGEIVEINEEVFDYFLDVLPPVNMGRVVEISGKQTRTAFGFAEGVEEIKYFWKQQGKFYCWRSNEINTRA